LASPVTLSLSSLGGGIGYDAKRASWNFPQPWRGGTWRFRNILDYEHAAVDALLDHAAKYRQTWLMNFWRVNKNALDRTAPGTGKPKPYAIVVPATQPDPANAFEMLRALQRGDVEIHRARVPFTAAGTRYPAGSHVILMSQPASAFANTLTDIQRYPDMRVSPGGAPQEAYDGTAYTVPLLMHVTVARVADPFEADLELVQSPVMAGRGSIVGGRATTAYAFAHDSAGIQALIRLAMDHVQVGWARTPFGPAGRRFSAGTIDRPSDGAAACARSHQCDRFGAVRNRLCAQRIVPIRMGCPPAKSGSL
jgi:hypothetical protein